MRPRLLLALAPLMFFGARAAAADPPKPPVADDPLAPPPSAPLSAGAAGTSPLDVPAGTAPAAPATAAAPPTETVTRVAEEPDKPKEFLLGARIGAIFPEPFNKLDANFLLDVELAWQLPVLDRKLGLFFDASYSRPTESGTRPDARLAGGTESYSLYIDDLGFTLGAQVVLPIKSKLLFIAGVGAKMHLTHSVINANAMGTDLGTNTEDNTRFGVVVRVAGGYRVGPGAIVVEAHFEYTPIDHLITGDNNTGHLSIQAGYLLML